MWMKGILQNSRNSHYNNEIVRNIIELHLKDEIMFLIWISRFKTPLLRKCYKVLLKYILLL